MENSKADIQLLSLVRHALDRGIDVGVVLTTNFTTYKWSNSTCL